MLECVQVAGWIAQSVKFPVIMDGDTGHGGIMAVRRMVRECIRAGIAGVRIDDQPIEGKRRTQSAGVTVVPLDQAIARYRAAVDMRNELDPDFVIMAQCYARDAENSGLDDALDRLKAYKEEAGVDWVQLESPAFGRGDQARARSWSNGPFSFMKGKLPRYLSLDEHRQLGVNIAWFPGFTHHVLWAALWDFMNDFQSRGIAAWEDFQAQRRDRPYPEPTVGDDGEGAAMQQKLEKLYFRRRLTCALNGSRFASPILRPACSVSARPGLTIPARPARCSASRCWSRSSPKASSATARSGRWRRIIAMPDTYATMISMIKDVCGAAPDRPAHLRCREHPRAVRQPGAGKLHGARRDRCRAL